VCRRPQEPESNLVLVFAGSREHAGNGAGAWGLMRLLPVGCSKFKPTRSPGTACHGRLRRRAFLNPLA
ncbi:MAG: hypothetical protein ACREO9_02095, partial [Lysobacterales bacterium]